MHRITFTYNQNQQHELALAVDASTANNIQLLFNRQTEHLIVNQGRLQRVEGFLGHLSYFWNQHAHESAVKEVISHAIRSVYGYLQNKEEEETALVLETLFKRMEGLRFGNYLDGYENANLVSLLERKKGEHITVRRGGIRRGFCHNKDQLRQKISQTLNELNLYFVENQATHIQKVVLKHIFTKSSLSRMGEDLYDRGAIAEGSKLEEILAEIFHSNLLPEDFRFNLTGKREELKRALKAYRNQHNKVEAKAAIKELFMNLVLAEYAFSYQLGLDLKTIGDGGSGGARYGRDRFARKLVVVKPGDEGPHGRNNPRLMAKIKRLFVSPRPSLIGNSEPQAEVDSYLLSERMGVDIVPPTELRYIPSHKFNGDHYKECSVQMFIRGNGEPPVTLGEYLGITPKMHLLPRFFLRWFLNKEGILRKIPQGLAERLAAHNLLIEDIDCHFDNVLVFQRGSDSTVFDRLFADQNVDGQIDLLFEGGFFKNNHGQSLLSALLYSEEVEIEGLNKKIAFAKHDGGSSNPHRHPEGILEKRFKHFFEVHPRFSHQFTLQEHFANRQQGFIEFLLEKGARALRNIHTAEVFRNYWNNPVYRQNFKTWILERGDNVNEARNAVLENLLEVNQVRDSAERERAYRIHYISHLNRIHGSISTRIDSWKILQKNLRNGTSMRQALQVVTPQDFERELMNYTIDDIELKLQEAQQRVVPQLPSQLQGKYFSGNIALIDLGERNG